MTQAKLASVFYAFSYSRSYYIGEVVGVEAALVVLLGGTHESGDFMISFERAVLKYSIAHTS